MMREQNIEMMGKEIKLEISAKAERELAGRVTPLFVEMELYFSCLLRKQIRIYENNGNLQAEKADGNFSVQLTDNLHISFRPVMTKSCSVSSCEGEKPPLSDFPIEKPQSYVPKWLKLDFRKGEWCGDFGY
jgi:hypothetical protein